MSDRVEWLSMLCSVYYELLLLLRRKIYFTTLCGLWEVSHYRQLLNSLKICEHVYWDTIKCSYWCFNNSNVRCAIVGSSLFCSTMNVNERVSCFRGVQLMGYKSYNCFLYVCRRILRALLDWILARELFILVNTNN